MFRIRLHLLYFNPRSLAGATLPLALNLSNHTYFNPRSLAGATKPFSIVLF